MVVGPFYILGKHVHQLHHHLGVVFHSKTVALVTLFDFLCTVINPEERERERSNAKLKDAVAKVGRKPTALQDDFKYDPNFLDPFSYPGCKWKGL